MRILFISGELGASELALVLKNEGHDVKLFIQDPEVQECYEGLITKISHWESELSWVGKDGIIIFDDIGFGEKQSELRSQGYRVVGGSKEGDRMESDRLVGAKVMESCGLATLPSFTFDNPESASRYIEQHKENTWVVKVNGGHVSSLCYVGTCPDQSDVLAILRHYKMMGVKTLNIQKRVEGIEIGVGRYFNGKDWVGPIEMNVEHKALMPGNIGPKTAEMGTLMWYDANEENKIFKSTLARLKQYLADIDFRGDVDVNCIVDQTSIWPLELTARFGNPSTALQIEMHLSPWGEFLSAIADQQEYTLNYKAGYGIVVTLAVPPFPYLVKEQTAESSKGLPIGFAQSFSEKDMQHYAFEEMSVSQDTGYFVAGSKGCIMHVSGQGDTITEARENVYKRIKNVYIPKAFYRHDIGLTFDQTEHSVLQKWGWL